MKKSMDDSGIIAAEVSVRHSSRSTNAEMKSKEANTKPTSFIQKASLTSTPSIKRSVVQVAFLCGLIASLFWSPCF